MITRDQVIEYLNTISSSDLESIFQECVEYTNNYLLEDKIMELESKIEALEEEVDFLRNYKDGYYE